MHQIFCAYSFIFHQPQVIIFFSVPHLNINSTVILVVCAGRQIFPEMSIAALINSSTY